MIKKLLSLLLVTAMLFSVTSALAPVAHGEAYFSSVIPVITEIRYSASESHIFSPEPWDGSSKSQPAGDGTKAAPFEISNGAELAWFAAYVNSASSSAQDRRDVDAVLTKDIDLNGKDWFNFRIGPSWNYTGTFDGRGHTIYNLFINHTSGQPGGLFMRVGLGGKNAAIKNLNFANAKIVCGIGSGITGATGYSVLVGRLGGADTVVENVKVSGEISVSGSEVNSVPVAGSIAGIMTTGTITCCYSDVSFKLANAKNAQTAYTNSAGASLGIGGIVGRSEAVASGSLTVTSSIRECVFDGVIDAPNNSRVAGILGSASSKLYNGIYDCHNNADITGYRQVAGIAAWLYEGTVCSMVPERIYNTGKITAKVSTDTYAAGLINGLKGTYLTYPAYSTGDVVIEENGVESFNKYCGLLYTNASISPYWETTCGIYNSQYGKAPLAARGVVPSDPANVSSASYGEFTDGTISEKLNTYEDSVIWYNEKGNNNTLPVTAPHFNNPLANVYTYYLNNESLGVVTDEPGKISFVISPVGNSPSVTVEGTETAILNKGTYTFNTKSTSFDITAHGKVFIEKILPGQIKETPIDEIISGPIEVKFPGDTPGTVVLGLYKNKTLLGTTLNKNVQPRLIDDISYITSRFDTSGYDLKDCTLKAFLWEDDTLKPLQESAYIGKFDGDAATKEEMQMAVSAVAESYYLKGSAIQYDDSLISEDIPRAEFGKENPESYSSKNVGYTNSQVFCYDVYKEALNVKLPATFDELINSQKMIMVTGSSSSVSKDDISSMLNTADILALEGEENKLLISAGNGEFIYADGESYNYENRSDSIEKDGAIKKTKLDKLDFSNYEKVTLLRPFNSLKSLAIPSQTSQRIKNMAGVSAEKTASVAPGETLQPGEEITYSINLKNTTASEKNINITDSIPENTSCNQATEWQISLMPYEEKTISYTITINNDPTLYGKHIEGTSANVGGLKVACYPIHIAKTLNETDQSRLDTAIQALNYSEFESFEMLNFIYTVAFTRAFTLTGTPASLLNNLYVNGSGELEGSSGSGEEADSDAMNLFKITVPGYFGGRKVDSSAEELFGMKRARFIDKQSLIAGDVILIHENISDASDGKTYIYDGEKIAEIKSGGMSFTDADAFLDKLLSYDRYLVIRPSAALSNLNNYPAEEELNLTPAQEAVIETAKSYMLRGGRMQYDDLVMFNLSDYRWVKAQKHPEDYTTNEWGYSNCAVFTYDVYYHALGYDIKYWNTGALNTGTDFHVYSHTNTYNPDTADETTIKPSEAQKAQVKQEVYETLQPGDIIVVRRFKSGSGHAMLYIGNGTIIHSGGQNYNTASSLETYEPTVRFKSLEDLFTEGDTCNLFGAVQYMKICRPLKSFTGDIPVNTVNRIDNMKGIVAEKTSSHSSSVTVNPGEEITYTISAYNTGKEPINLEIKDIVPQNATYVSGAENVDGNTLSWQITVPSREKASVTYKIKVNENASFDTFIDNSKATVGGVMVRCPDVLIKHSLTAEEQENIKEAIKTLVAAEKYSGPELANQIYKTAIGVDDLLYDYDNNGILEIEDVQNGTFMQTTYNSTNGFKINHNTAYGQMVAGNLYGGRKYNAPVFSGECTPMAKKHNIMVGDILIGRTLSSMVIYIYDGENFINLTTRISYEPDTRLMKVLGYGNNYAVLRPSFLIE